MAELEGKSFRVAREKFESSQGSGLSILVSNFVGVGVDKEDRLVKILESRRAMIYRRRTAPKAFRNHPCGFIN